VKEHSVSQYLAEFRTRPAIERRAASIHIHVDGDKGPSMIEVTNSCLHVLFALLEHPNGAQLGQIMKAALDSLDVLKGWDKLEHCCWFAQKAAEWSQYQYRYAVPTWLVERLLESPDTSTATSLHNTLASMVTTVFRSPTPLVNLSTSDIIANLITLIFRRININPDDTLLSPLVSCIASLGTHVYYSDQIQDLAGDLISRLVVVEVQGIGNCGKGSNEQCRSQAIRCLLAGLRELMGAATRAQNRETNKDSPTPIPTTSFSSSADAPAEVRTARRSRVSPGTWQDTLSLLCDRDHAVRTDYSDALVFYLTREIKKRGNTTDRDGVKRVRPLADGLQQASNANAVLYGDSSTRFLNAVHAYSYILATTSLDFGSSSAPSLTEEGTSVINVLPATPVNSVGNVDILPQSQGSRRSTTLGPRARKVSAVQRLLDRVPSRISSSGSAFASDYSNMLMVQTAVHEQLPIRALLTGIPMLLVLDKTTKINDISDADIWQRSKAIKEMIARVWLVIAKVWNISELASIAQKVFFHFHRIS
jgi:hypothetical protein